MGYADRDVRISIHALREEGDNLTTIRSRLFLISIHALREEGDSIARGRPCGRTYFYPRPPRGGRPFRRFWGVEKWLISIHALREEGDMTARATIDRLMISIHALREEGD